MKNESLAFKAGIDLFPSPFFVTSIQMDYNRPMTDGVIGKTEGDGKMRQSLSNKTYL